jgi:addiction module RelE/StbE family toxin
MAEIKRIIWSEEAWSDLESIIEYISKDSEYYAVNFVNKIIDTVEILEIFPEAGRIVPEYNNPQLREIIYKNYRIVYKVSKNINEILTVFHGSKHLD